MSGRYSSSERSAFDNLVQSLENLRLRQCYDRDAKVGKKAHGRSNQADRENRSLQHNIEQRHADADLARLEAKLDKLSNDRACPSRGHADQHENDLRDNVNMNYNQRSSPKTAPFENWSREEQRRANRQAIELMFQKDVSDEQRQANQHAADVLFQPKATSEGGLTREYMYYGRTDQHSSAESTRAKVQAPSSEFEKLWADPRLAYLRDFDERVQLTKEETKLLAGYTGQSTSKISDKKKAQTYTCAGCDTQLSGASCTFTSSEDIGFYCKSCNDGEGRFDVYCGDCVFDGGQFCCGTCELLYCFECKGYDEFLGADGQDRFCSRECTKSNPCAWDQYKNHRRSYKTLYESSEGDEELDNFQAHCGIRQCEGITQRGARCKVTSSHSYASATPLQEGDRFCTHHGGEAGDDYW